MEHILITKQINARNYLISEARLNRNNFGLKILTPFKFAKYVLEKNGIVMNEDYIENDKRPLFIFNDLKNEKYFQNSNLTDAANVINSLDLLRLQVIDNEEDNIINNLQKGEFIDKNTALITIYQTYISKIKELNLYDDIMLYRYILDNNLTTNLDISIYEFEDLTLLEKELITKCSKSVNYINTKPNYLVDNYYKCYGQTNEIENVLNYISKNNLKLDDCCIALTNPSIYKTTLENYSMLYDIPMSFVISEPINSASIGNIITKLINHKNENYGKDTFLSLINDSSFDKTKLIKLLLIEEDNVELINKVIEFISNLRFSLDIDSNKEKINKIRLLCSNHICNEDDKKYKEIESYLEYVEEFNNILAKGIIYILEEFTITKSSIDTLAISKVSMFLDEGIKLNISFKYLIEYIQTITVSSSTIIEGSLIVTTIPKALSLCRKHLFILGLSSNLFPGNPKENPLLLDSDLELFNINNYSEYSINKKINLLKELISINNNNGSNVYLSYSYLNIDDLKLNNPSSVLYNLYIECHNDDLSLKEFNDKFKDIKYFDSNISPIKELGLATLDSKNKIIPNEIITNTSTSSIDYSKIKLSASKINDYFTCPYKFYLKHIIGLEDLYEQDYNKVIQANDFGTLIHSVLQNNNFNNKSIEEIINYGKTLLDEYLTIHIPLSESLIQKEYELIEDCINNAAILAENDDSYLVKEEDFYFKHKTGLIIHGLPDAVVQSKDGKLSVIDYKIKNYIEHDENDSETITQVVGYAYILSHKYPDKYNISNGEYRYLKQGSCVFIDNMKNEYDKYDNNLLKIKESFDSGIFDTINNKDKEKENKYCAYCYFKKIGQCPKYKDAEEDEE